MKQFDQVVRRIKIRRDGVFSDSPIRPGAEALDGSVFTFEAMWIIHPEESALYGGEWAMRAVDDHYPKDAPTWIASGDLVAPNDVRTE